MAFTRILCPTDFSPGSRHAIGIAARIAREDNAALVLVHSWHVSASAYSREALIPPHIIQDIVDDAQRALDAAAKEVTAQSGIAPKQKLRTGEPWAQIIEELETDVYDLCVMATHGRTGLAHLLLGSVTEKVVRHAPCSVLTVRPDGDARPFHHALVATDLSESAEYSLDLAATLVEPSGSITLVHVIEVPVAVFGEVPVADVAQELDERTASALGKEIDRFRRTSKLPISLRSRMGYPGSQIQAAIEDDPTFDLVAVGSHGRTGIKRALLGSVSEKVVRHARCSVLVARNRGERSHP